VPANGGTVEIVATLLDADGNRVAGVPVSFSTTAGTLTAGTVTSGDQGEARTRLTTTRQATVTATAGAATPATVTVNVNSAPSVGITATPPSPTAGQAATFTFTITPGTNPAAVRDLTIDFGDGERLTLTSPTNTATIAHTYEDGGTYTVTATVTDVNGERSVATLVLTVQEPAALAVTLNLLDTAPVNTPVSMRVAVTGDTTPSRVLRYEWDFGDGTTASVNSPQINHVYTSPGRKTVRATVVTTDGARFTAQAEINITPATGG
jgi:PKD repeat protein